MSDKVSKGKGPAAAAPRRNVLSHHQHKLAFNRRVFNTDLEGAPLIGREKDPEKSNQLSRERSNEMTRDQWLHHIEVCNTWDIPDQDMRRKFRQENKKGYGIVAKCKTVKVKLPSGEEL